MVTKPVVVLSGMAYKTVFDVIIVHVTPSYRNLTHVYNFKEILLFARSPWQTESSLHITLCR